MLRQAMALLVIGCLTGCAEGRDMSSEEARKYLDQHETQLNAIITQIESCQPVFKDAGVYNAIRLRDVSQDDPVCARSNGATVTDIKTGMRKAQVRVLDFQLDEQGKIATADFTVFSSGLAVSGVSTSIVYYADAHAKEVADQEAYKSMSLRPLPSRWYWVRDAR